MTFRYFYDGAYREVYVPAGGRTVLDVATAGVFPFSAVSDSYVASGSFNGGAWIPPDGWDGPPPPTTPRRQTRRCTRTSQPMSRPITRPSRSAR